MGQKQIVERKTLAVLEKKKNNWQIEVCELPGGTFSIREWSPNGEMGHGVNLSKTGQDALLCYLLGQLGAEAALGTVSEPATPAKPSQPVSNVFNSAQASSAGVNTGAPNTSAILDMLKGM